MTSWWNFLYKYCKGNNIFKNRTIQDESIKGGRGSLISHEGILNKRSTTRARRNYVRSRDDILNALPDEWGNFISSIYGKKEATSFSDLWSLCKIEETRLKAKNDVGSNEQTQAYVAMTRRKGKFGKFEPQKKFQKKIDMSNIQCYECNEYGHFKSNCPIL